MKLRIVDTHLHLVYQQRFHYPWLVDAPKLNHEFTLEAYRAEAEPSGITRMLHMEVDVAEDDIEAETAFVTSLGDGMVGAIAACRPESTGFAAMLERYAQNPKVRGLRRILHESPDELGQRPIFAENLKRLARLWSELRFLRAAAPDPDRDRLAKAAPDVQFIVDHCGVPNVKDKAFEPWRTNMTAIAELPNVAAKISGVIAYGDPDQLDRRRSAPVRGAHDFGLWLGSRRLGFGPPGLHADRQSDALGGCDARDHCTARARTRRPSSCTPMPSGSIGSPDPPLPEVHGKDWRMQRMGQVLALKPDAIAEYKRLHAAVWPAVLAKIADCNIRTIRSI